MRHIDLGELLKQEIFFQVLCPILTAFRTSALMTFTEPSSSGGGSIIAEFEAARGG